MLRPLAQANPRVVYGLMFAAAAGVLKDLAAQRIDARLGITAVLHTWASDLLYHPHIHRIVTGGGLHRDDDHWVASRKDFLFPGRIMGRMFRGRMLQGLIPHNHTARDAGELDLGGGEPTVVANTARTLFRSLSKRYAQWVVHVVRYLARTVKRVAISDARTVAVTDRHVTFQSLSGLGRPSGLVRLSGPLPGKHCVQRFPRHILPSGFHRVLLTARHHGLYAPGGAKRRRELARALVALRPETDPHGDERLPGDPTDQADEGTDAEICPACGAAQVYVHVHRIFLRVGQPERARGPP